MPTLSRNELAANCCPARLSFLRFEAKKRVPPGSCSGLVFGEFGGLFSKDLCIFKEKPFSTEINVLLARRLIKKVAAAP